ncbi:hypothetical protein XELAEV_18035655mg [Xenopus laevis]|uniref:Uncharacterized protein n=1 Tax=Xenopus laevis TaxID=8355 RepID=A0A974CIB2_XENLA|nr:hypothetical protein XELAEV_18035655mg [Xenopus laevis]
MGTIHLYISKGNMCIDSCTVWLEGDCIVLNICENVARVRTCIQTPLHQCQVPTSMSLQQKHSITHFLLKKNVYSLCPQ